MVYPLALHPALRSLQDTIPTHAAIVSQEVGKAALEVKTEVGRKGGEGLEKPREENATTPMDETTHFSHVFDSFDNPSPLSLIHTLSIYLHPYTYTHMYVHTYMLIYMYLYRYSGSGPKFVHSRPVESDCGPSSPSTAPPPSARMAPSTSSRNYPLR